MPSWGAGRASAAAAVTDLDDDLARETMGATKGRNTEFGRTAGNTVSFAAETNGTTNQQMTGSLAVLDAFLKKHVYDVINEF